LVKLPMFGQRKNAMRWIRSYWLGQLTGETRARFAIDNDATEAPNRHSEFSRRSPGTFPKLVLRLRHRNRIRVLFRSSALREHRFARLTRCNRRSLTAILVSSSSYRSRRLLSLVHEAMDRSSGKPCRQRCADISFLIGDLKGWNRSQARLAKARVWRRVRKSRDERRRRTSCLLQTRPAP
jgi:hypothetical protein